MKRSGPGGTKAALAALFGSAASLALTGAAWAQAGAPVAIGRPVDGAIDMQGAATAVSGDIHAFHNFVLVIITAITLLVLALLLWIIVRYNRKANPVARKFTHNTTVEVIWTVVPVIILVLIAIQSFPLLSKEEHVPKTELTVKAVGNQWYWSYEYPDHNVSFDSRRLSRADAGAKNRPYLLAVDNPIVVPVGVNVKVIITSNDVIHSFSVPSFGVKQDAIPGKLNQGWFNVIAPGVYYGQCSQLCGIEHAFMPIEVDAVSKEDFNKWILSKGGKLTASAEPAPPGAVPAAPAQPAGAPAANPAR